MNSSKKLCLLSALATFIALTLLLLFRPYISWRHDMPPTDFKKQWAGKANFIAIGDSRTMLSLNPNIITKKLGKNEFGVNFAFSAVALSESYLAATKKNFVKKGRRIILIGISPHSLSPSAFQSKSFESLSKVTLGRSLFEKALSNKRYVISTMPKIEILHLLQKNRKPPDLEKHIKASGWVQAHWKGTDSDKDSVKNYAEKFSHGTINNSRIKTLCKSIKKLNDEGIFVFGFRPPVTKDMYTLENKLSGFNESEIKKKFIAAGGHWVNIEPYGKYRSYDGSHLTIDAATSFSNDIAHAINKILIKQPQ